MLIKFNVVVLLEDHHVTFAGLHCNSKTALQVRQEREAQLESNVLLLCASLRGLLTDQCNSPTAIVRSVSCHPFSRYTRGHTPEHDEKLRKHAEKADALISVEVELEWRHVFRFGSHNHALALIDMAINNAPTLLAPRKYITLSKTVQRYEHS